MKRRFRNFRQLVKTLIILVVLGVGLPLPPNSAQAMGCRESINPSPSHPEGFRGWLQHVTDNLPAWISRFRPAYRDDQFTIRILSRSSELNSRSPRELLDTAVAKVQQLRTAFGELGFTFSRQVHILVDAHHGATWVNAVTPIQRVVSVPLFDRGPLVSNLACSFEIPGFFVTRKVLGHSNRASFPQDQALYMGLPFLTSRVHSIDHTFAVTHEFAHTTEPAHSHRSVLWIEARADFLTFLVTGKTDLVWPRELHQFIVNSRGHRERIYTPGVRSLSRPLISNLSLLMPDLKLGHSNSELISHVLFRIHQSLGRERSLQLVHWMDALSGDRLLPALLPQTALAKTKTEPRSDSVYIDSSRVSVVRNAIRGQALMIAELFREWGVSARLTPDETHLLQRILAEAELQ